MWEQLVDSSGQESEVGKLSRVNREYEKNNQELKIQVEQEKKTNSSALAHLREQVKQNASLRRQLSSLQNNSKYDKIAAEGLTKKAGILDLQCNNLREDQAKLLDENKKMKSRIAELEESLNDDRTKRLKEMHEIQRLKEKNVELEANRSVADADARGAQESLLKKLQQLESAMSANDQMRATIDQQAREIISFTKDAFETKQRQRAQNEAVLRLEASVSERTKERDGFEQEVWRLRRELLSLAATPGEKSLAGYSSYGGSGEGGGGGGSRGASRASTSHGGSRGNSNSRNSSNSSSRPVSSLSGNHHHGTLPSMPPPSPSSHTLSLSQPHSHSHSHSHSHALTINTSSFGEESFWDDDAGSGSGGRAFGTSGGGGGGGGSVLSPIATAQRPYTVAANSFTGSNSRAMPRSLPTTPITITRSLSVPFFRNTELSSLDGYNDSGDGDVGGGGDGGKGSRGGRKSDFSGNNANDNDNDNTNNPSIVTFAADNFDGNTQLNNFNFNNNINNNNNNDSKNKLSRNNSHNSILNNNSNNNSNAKRNINSRDSHGGGGGGGGGGGSSSLGQRSGSMFVGNGLGIKRESVSVGSKGSAKSVLMKIMKEWEENN